MRFIAKRFLYSWRDYWQSMILYYYSITAAAEKQEDDRRWWTEGEFTKLNNDIMTDTGYEPEVMS